MTPDILTLALATVALLGAACWAWGDVLAREAMDREMDRHAKVAERIEAAFTDSMQCDLCHAESRERELVALYDDAALCCIPCAETIKVRRGRQEAA